MSDDATWVDRVLSEAIARGASTVHFEPDGGALRVRMRVEGALTEATDAPTGHREAIMSRLKALAGLSLDERRLPQEGRAVVQGADLWVATVPARQGESAVVQLLSCVPLVLELERQGLEADPMASLRAALEGTPGLIALVGPTGSGRHTMQYAILHELLRGGGRKVVTIESPVRHTFSAMVQIETHDEIGLNMAALRVSQRLDADVISVGDIPDYETLEQLAHAVARGRRAVATAHVSTARGALSRMLNMGLEPWVVAETVALVQAQRLVRRLCEACKRDDDEGIGGYRAVGCDACHQTGWAGRMLVVESLAMTPDVRRALVRGEPVATERTLRQAALALAHVGKTTVGEAQRATPPDDAFML